ncbi:MAG: DUF4230 domain-containing protein [Acidimicrobiia bacterium]
MTTLLEERPATRDPQVTVRLVTEEGRRGGGGGGRSFGGLLHTAGLGAIAFAILLVVGAITGLVDLGGIFGSGTTTTSSKVLLKEIKNLSSYVAIEGTYQEDITIKKGVPILPDFIAGESTTLRAVGTVPVSVDFKVLATDAVQVNADNSVRITLSSPELGNAVIDPKQSEITDRSRGLVNRLGDAFEGDPVNDRPLYVKAENRIEKAARENNLVDRAKQNTANMLEAFLSRLGFTDVNVTFEKPPTRGAGN